jgi:hypothetical protein
MPDLQSLRFGSTVADEELEWLRQRARSIYENTPYAMLGAGYGSSFSSGFGGIPWQDWMCLLVAEPNYCRDGLMLAAEATVARLKLVDQAVGEYVAAWMVAADDMGTQKGEYFRAETFMEVIQPAYKHVCQWMRANSRMKSFLHCCDRQRSDPRDMRPVLGCYVLLLREPDDFSSDLDGILGSVEAGDAANAAAAVPRGLPERFPSDAVGAHRPDSGDDYATIHPISKMSLCKMSLCDPGIGPREQNGNKKMSNKQARGIRSKSTARSGRGSALIRDPSVYHFVRMANHAPVLV